MFPSRSKEPADRERVLTDADKGVLLMVAMVITFVVLVASFVVALAA